MFRLTQYMRELVAPTPVRERRGPVKPVVIWNLTRRCNLRCRHCYTTSADVSFPGELSHEQAMGVLDERELRIVQARRLVEEGETLETIGRRLGISKERVRQIEARALEKLRSALLARQPDRAAFV